MSEAGIKYLYICTASYVVHKHVFMLLQYLLHLHKPTSHTPHSLHTLIPHTPSFLTLLTQFSHTLTPHTPHFHTPPLIVNQPLSAPTSRSQWKPSECGSVNRRRPRLMQSHYRQPHPLLRAILVALCGASLTKIKTFSLKR